MNSSMNKIITLTIGLLILLSLTMASSTTAQRTRPSVGAANQNEGPAEVDRREAERLLRAYWDERLLKCRDSYWWVLRYPGGQQGLTRSLYQGRGTPSFVFAGHYNAPVRLSKADQLNGVNPQPVEYEGEMSVRFEVARCANCPDDDQWKDDFSVTRNISKKLGRWIIGESQDLYFSTRMPTCGDDGKIKYGDAYLSPKVARVEASRSPASDVYNADVYVKKIIVAKDDNGNPGEPTTRFEPEDRIIYCVVELSSAKVGTKVRLVWKTVDLGGSVGEEIKTIDYTTKSDENKVVQGHITLRRDWPRGLYRVEVYINGALDKSTNYTVE